MTKDNGIASAEDFRKAAEADAFEEPRRIVLPASGFAVVLRRPRPMAFTLLRHPLPQSLASRVSEFAAGTGAGQEFPLPKPEYSAEELAALSRRAVEMLSLVFVAPRLSLTPGPNEIHPNWLPPEDQTFILRWMGGEVADDGSDLAGFRRGDEGSGADPRATGGAVEMPALGDAEGSDMRLPT